MRSLLMAAKGDANFNVRFDKIGLKQIIVLKEMKIKTCGVSK